MDCIKKSNILLMSKIVVGFLDPLATTKAQLEEYAKLHNFKLYMCNYQSPSGYTYFISLILECGLYKSWLKYIKCSNITEGELEACSQILDELNLKCDCDSIRELTISDKIIRAMKNGARLETAIARAVDLTQDVASDELHKMWKDGKVRKTEGGIWKLS